MLDLAGKVYKGSVGLSGFLAVDLNKIMACIQYNLLSLAFFPRHAGNAGAKTEHHQLGSGMLSARLCHSSVKPTSLWPPLLSSLWDGENCKEALMLPANIHLQLLQYMCTGAEQTHCNARGNLFKCLSVAALLHTLHKSHNQSCLFSMVLRAETSA